MKTKTSGMMMTITITEQQRRTTAHALLVCSS